MKVEVIGVDPPCKRCQATYKSVEEAASELKKKGVDEKISKMNIHSRETISRYGLLLSPAIAINDTVKVMGRVPDKKEVGRLIMESIGWLGGIEA